MQLSFRCFLEMGGFMRIAFCRNVRLDFSKLRYEQPPTDPYFKAIGEQFRAKLDRLFADLTDQEIHVDVLSIVCRTEEVAELITRKGST